VPAGEEGAEQPHTARMWAGAEGPIAASTSHPFLLKMLDGSLPVAQFRYYVEQVRPCGAVSAQPVGPRRAVSR
jgi:hypothetical protein